jgi:hypothetical protein
MAAKHPTARNLPAKYRHQLIGAGLGAAVIGLSMISALAALALGFWL